MIGHKHVSKGVCKGPAEHVDLGQAFLLAAGTDPQSFRSLSNHVWKASSSSLRTPTAPVGSFDS